MMNLKTSILLLDERISREVRLVPLQSDESTSGLRNTCTAHELAVALDNNQFELYYQPIIDINTNKIAKLEALIRWNHPTRGFISPAEFIPVAEQVGLIGPLGDWVFKQAANYAEHLQVVVRGGIPISFNVSPAQFSPINVKYCQEWINYLADIGLPRHSLCVEITEGLLLENDTSTMSMIDQLRYHGVDVAIDDFGTGYSALGYLKKFNFNYLKIDRAFVRDIETSPFDHVIVEAIVMMSTRLGFNVIAEGIENQEQAQILKCLGVNYCQGYLFSKPMSADTVEALVESQADKPKFAL